MAEVGEYLKGDYYRNGHLVSGHWVRSHYRSNPSYCGRSTGLWFPPAIPTPVVSPVEEPVIVELEEKEVLVVEEPMPVLTKKLPRYQNACNGNSMG